MTPEHLARIERNARTASAMIHMVSLAVKLQNGTRLQSYVFPDDCLDVAAQYAAALPVRYISLSGFGDAYLFHVPRPHRTVDR